jgi:hypothetical protein
MWLRPDATDLWEQVDRRTYGTVDQDEDVLWHAHARIERLAWERAHPAPAEKAHVKRRVSAPDRRFRALTRQLLVG